MPFNAPFRGTGAGLLVAATLLSGCAVPLGPGFSHPSSQIQVAGTQQEPGRVSLHITDRLSNTGKGALNSLDIDLSAGAAIMPESLTVRIDGRETQLSPRSADRAMPQHIDFARPWPPKEIRTVVLNYDIATAPCDCAVSTSTRDGFYIADPAAFPAWQPPLGLLAKSDPTARTATMEVTAPADFKVLAAGREQRAVRQGSAVSRQFRLRAKDFPIYVIAGKYQEQRISTQHGDVILWTLRPLAGGAAKALAERLTASAATFAQAFGPLSKTPRQLRVVEAPVPGEPATNKITASSFPDGILLDGRSLARSESDEVLERADYELARTWFGWRSQPSPDSQILLGSGISEFAVALAAEDRGGQAARRAELTRLLALYDSARPQAKSDALIALPSGTDWQQERSSSYRAALFFAALEDRAGRMNFELAMRRFVAAMTGQEISYPELRSALETAAGQDFAPIFRAWLDRAGIPDDFRARYGTAH